LNLQITGLSARTQTAEFILFPNCPLFRGFTVIIAARWLEAVVYIANIECALLPKLRILYIAVLSLYEGHTELPWRLYLLSQKSLIALY